MRLSTTTPDSRRLARRLFDELAIAPERAIGASMLEALVAHALDHGRRLEAGFVTGDRHCRVCGCTGLRACRSPEGACFWTERDLCSACAPYPED